MKKILLLISLTILFSYIAKAQKFEFNSIQSGSISAEALFSMEKEALGKVEPIETYVEFTWYGNSTKVVGKTIKGDILFEFGKGLGHRFCLDYSDENHLNIVVVKVEDLEVDKDANGIATIEIDPNENKFDVYFPEMFTADPLDLIRFISKDDESQKNANLQAYESLRKKLLDAGFLEK